MRRGFSMISVTHFAAADDGFPERARVALEALSARSGYLRGSLGRSLDDHDWLLITEWENVGSYRRALGSYEVKLLATSLLADALELPSSFEALIEVAPGGAMVHRTGDKA